MAFQKAEAFPPQFEDVNGRPLVLGTIEFYVWNTTTPTPIYFDADGLASATTVTLNLTGRPSNGGVAVDLFYDTTVIYKIILKDAYGTVVDTLGPFSAPISSGSLSDTSDADLADYLIGVKRTLPGAIATNLHNFIEGSEIYLQRDFGCAADGVTDDTSKIEAAIAAASNGDVIVFERGTYLVSSFAPITKRLTFIGWNFGATIIQTNSETEDVFVANGFYVRFENLMFTASVTRTAGSYVWFNSSGSYGRMVNCYCKNYYTAVQITAAASVQINSVVCDQPAANAVAILMDGGNEHFLSQVEVGGGGVGAQGLYIANCTSAQFTDINVLDHGVDLYIAPGAGQTAANLYFENSFFDTATRGIQISPSGTGSVIRVRFSGCWTSTHDSHGVLVAAAGGWSGVIAGLEFTDHHSLGNGAEGLEIADGININISGGFYLGNVNSGIFMEADVSDFIIRGVRSGSETGVYAGNSRYGIEIATGASDHYIIEHCDLRGNTLGPLLNGGSGTDRIIGHNLGHVTQGKGQASITAANTTVAVTHGLSGTPNLQDIRLVPLTSLGSSVTYWVSNPTSTQFTINVNTAPGVTISWGWEARITGD